MNREKHTAAPWYISRDNFNNSDHEDKIAAIVSEDEWIIAEVCGDVVGAKANAHLLAHAPDLLASAKAIVAELPSKRDWLNPVVEAQLRLAIELAKGAWNAQS